MFNITKRHLRSKSCAERRLVTVIRFWHNCILPLHKTPHNIYILQRPSNVLYYLHQVYNKKKLTWLWLKCVLYAPKVWYIVLSYALCTPAYNQCIKRHTCCKCLGITCTRYIRKKVKVGLANMQLKAYKRLNPPITG